MVIQSITLVRVPVWHDPRHHNEMALPFLRYEERVVVVMASSLCCPAHARGGETFMYVLGYVRNAGAIPLPLESLEYNNLLPRNPVPTRHRRTVQDWIASADSMKYEPCGMMDVKGAN